MSRSVDYLRILAGEFALPGEKHITNTTIPSQMTTDEFKEYMQLRYPDYYDLRVESNFVVTGNPPVAQTSSEATYMNGYEDPLIALYGKLRKTT